MKIDQKMQINIIYSIKEIIRRIRNYRKQKCQRESLFNRMEESFHMNNIFLH